MQRDVMEFDVVCVGAGVASLATALRLVKRAKSDGSGTLPRVLVLDKGAAVGAHVLSGAVVDPAPMAELLDEKELGALPIFSRVTDESFRFLTPRAGVQLPWLPPVMRSKGYPIVSLSAMTRHLAHCCDAAGVEVHAGFSAAQLLEQDGRITGVRVGDKGVAKDGSRRSIFQHGPDIGAKAVVLGEGASGVLTEALINGRKLRTGNPQTYALGIKELIEIPERKGTAGRILHTFGYPHDAKTYGGGFVFGMSDRLVAIGLVTGLDYRNPKLNPHDLYRLFKLHPAVSPIIAGGRVVEYGAKVVPEGGFNSLPALAVSGAVIVGDGAGLLDSLRLKGIHLAVQSGLAAGDTLFECWKAGDFSQDALAKYPERLSRMSGWKQLRQVRNVRASFARGRIPGMIAAGLSMLTGGRLPPGRVRIENDSGAFRRHRTTTAPLKARAADAALQLDRLSDVFFSRTHHEENQPSHLKILKPERCGDCLAQYGAPCTRFCPAQVYSLAEDGRSIRVDFSNCLHCKTCQIKDPLENIDWTLPEGGGGPRYMRM